MTPKWDEEHIKRQVEECIEELGPMGEIAEISLLEIEEIKPDHAIVEICGGCNYIGEHNQWQDYLAALSRLLNLLHIVFGAAWVVDLENDCLDDIFYVRIAVANCEFDLDDCDPEAATILF